MDQATNDDQCNDNCWPNRGQTLLWFAALAVLGLNPMDAIGFAIGHPTDIFLLLSAVYSSSKR